MFARIVQTMNRLGWIVGLQTHIFTTNNTRHCRKTFAGLGNLRHSAASELINAGVDIYTVGRVLGHKDPRSTQQYSHLAVDTLAVAIGKIGGKAA